VILIDLNETLAFECDRLDSSQDFAGTYSALGGATLRDEQVNLLAIDACDRMRQVGREPGRYESFPSIVDVLSSEGPATRISKDERERIAAVVGLHEVGVIPSHIADSVHRLHARYRLGLVSNMWADSRFSRQAIRDAGIEECFDTMIFSSDHGVTKPSARIFQLAFEEMDATPDASVYVGNSLRRDVVGAQNAGIPSIWISHKSALPPNSTPTAIAETFPDFVDSVT